MNITISRGMQPMSASEDIRAGPQGLSKAMMDRRPIFIVLLTTSDLRSSRVNDLHKMLRSVNAFVQPCPDVRVQHFILMQQMTDSDRRAFAPELPNFVTVHSIDCRASLSKARNLLLSRQLVGDAIMRADAVGFPDDDCWYAEGTLSHIAEAFRKDQDLDFWFCRYGSRPIAPVEGGDVEPSLQTVIARAASNTMFIRGSIVQAVGSFDEMLGVGAAINGGEDTDYALRTYYLAKKTRFLDVRCVGHRDFDPKLRDRCWLSAVMRKKGPKGPFLSPARYLWASI